MPKKINRKIITAIYILLGILIAGFYVEWLAQGLKEFLINKLDGYFEPVFYSILFLGIVILIYIEINFVDKDARPSNKRADSDSNRNRLIESTRLRINSRISQKLNSNLNFEMELTLKYIKTPAKDIIHKKFIAKNIKVNISNYIELFNTYYNDLKRLLIIGEPGAGKSLLLLRLEEYLLDKAELDNNQPIPIIINLASWNPDKEKFEKWLEKELQFSAGEAGISKEIAIQLLESFQIIPLLDGLDEVPINLQNNCLTKLEEYLELRNNQYSLISKYPQVAICCRRKEYNNLSKGIPVFATITILPLSQKAVIQSLNSLIESKQNKAAAILKIALKNDATLRKALNSAFFVHTALSICNYKNGKNLISKLGEEDFLTYQINIINVYLDIEIEKVVSLTNLSAKKIRKYLSWLAISLSETKKGVNFELADLQLDWISKKRGYALFYWLLYGLIGGIVGGLILALVGSWIIGFPEILFIGLFGGIFGGLIGGLAGTLIKRDSYISYNDIVVITFSRFNFNSFIGSLKINLAHGLLYGLAHGGLGGLAFGLFGDLDNGLKGGITLGLVIAIFWGLLYGVITSLIIGATKSKNFVKLKNSYQRVSSDLLMRFIQFGLIGSILAYPSEQAPHRSPSGINLPNSDNLVPLIRSKVSLSQS